MAKKKSPEIYRCHNCGSPTLSNGEVISDEAASKMGFERETAKGVHGYGCCLLAGLDSRDLLSVNQAMAF